MMGCGFLKIGINFNKRIPMNSWDSKNWPSLQCWISFSMSVLRIESCRAFLVRFSQWIFR